MYYNPTDDVIDNYLYLSNTKPVVVKNKVSEAPTESVEGVKVPSLEMILVDLFCDKRLFKAYQGNELAHTYLKHGNSMNMEIRNDSKLRCFMKNVDSTSGQ